MGYTTEFKGVLAFGNDPDRQTLRAIREILSEDVREHPEWGIKGDPGFYFIDLEFTEDFGGLKWSGAEKSYGMVEQVNFLTRHVRKVAPGFNLTGSFEAHGEESDDAWTLSMENGVAVKKPRTLPGVKTICPECDYRFRVMPDGKVAS